MGIRAFLTSCHFCIEPCNRRHSILFRSRCTALRRCRWTCSCQDRIPDMRSRFVILVLLSTDRRVANMTVLYERRGKRNSGMRLAYITQGTRHGLSSLLLSFTPRPRGRVRNKGNKRRGRYFKFTVIRVKALTHLSTANYTPPLLVRNTASATARDNIEDGIRQITSTTRVFNPDSAHLLGYLIITFSAPAPRFTEPRRNPLPGALNTTPALRPHLGHTSSSTSVPS